MNSVTIPERYNRTKRKKILLAFARIVLGILFAFLAGMDAFLFSTNPFVFLPVGVGVGIVSVKMGEKMRLLAFDVLVGVFAGWLSYFISSAERYMIVWLGVSVGAFLVTCFLLIPRNRQRFTNRGRFFVGFSPVVFIATLVIIASFLFPIPFLRAAGVQTSFVAVNSRNNKELLLDYSKQINDSAAGLNYLELLNWTRRRLTWGAATSMNDPIKILKVGHGACEDYAWVYVGLMVANNYTVRLILDESFSIWPMKEAGNHSWVEVFINGTWVTVDPSLDPSYGVNNPYLYARGWNKAINHVYAVTENGILDVTSSYIPTS